MTWSWARKLREVSDLPEAGLQGGKAGRFQLGKERSGRLGQMQL